MAKETSFRTSNLQKTEFIGKIPLVENLAWRLIELMNLTIEGHEQAQTTIDHLQEGGSAIMVFNHPSLIDPGLFIRMKEEVFSQAVRNMGFFASIKFQDGRMGMYGPMVQKLAKKHGIDMYFVSQAYDTNYTAMQKAAFYRQARESVIGHLLSHGGSAGLSLEGGRETQGTLEPAQPVLGNLFYKEPKLIDRTLIQPIAIDGSYQILPPSSSILEVNLKPPVTLRIGEPLTYDQVVQESGDFNVSFGDAVMLHIAELLPEETWGVYAHKLNEFYENRTQQQAT